MTAEYMKCVLPAEASLGESPVWSGRDQALFWVDIEGRSVHRFDPVTGADIAVAVPARPGSIALTRRPGTLLVAMEHELVWLDFDSGEVTPWIELEPAGTGNRLNDGRCDPQGRFWVGSMYERPTENRFTGILHRIESDGTTAEVKTGIGVSNALVFSPDGATMYHADTLRETVWAYDYDGDTGSVSGERVFIDFSDLPGRPDGACADADGCVWIACVYGSSVIRVTPRGEIDRRVMLSAEKPSMPAFGGSALDTLFVTTISIGSSLPSSGPEVDPGGLFALDVGVKGVPEPRFAGRPPTP